MHLTAGDATGSGAGWRVTVQSSDFAYTGSSGGTAIPAARFSIASAGAPAMISGQGVESGGPRVPAGSAASGTLDQPRTVLQADAGSGAGTYSQGLAVRLDIPGQSRAGTYVATLMISMSAAP